MTESLTAAATGTTPLDLPLEGVRVVALEQAVAAPLATRHLADLGAEVVKVERVGEGDFARAYDASVNGVASHFVWLNRGKESIALDLKSDEGRELVLSLLDEADVLVQNLAPGAAERLGLGPDAVTARNPRLVVVGLTGYGTSGPHRDRKAYDMLVQAESGLVSITGTPQDATVEWLGHPMYVQLYEGRQILRMGLSHAAIAPYDAYPTIDGQVLIGIQNDRGWQLLSHKVFQDPELAGDPRFLTNLDRVSHRAELDAAVAERSRRMTTAELEEALAATGVAAAQVNDMAGLVEHPQLHERDRWREVGTETGPVRALLPPMTFRDVELPMGDVPALGQHTTDVLERLGRTPEEIAALRERRTVQ